MLEVDSRKETTLKDTQKKPSDVEPSNIFNKAGTYDGDTEANDQRRDQSVWS